MFVPGSPFPSPTDHPRSWYVVLKDRHTGKQETIWVNGTQLTRESVAEFCALHYHGGEVLSIDVCTQMPTRVLKPVPATLFEYGARIIAEQELSGTSINPFRKDFLHPITLKPINLKPLVRR